MAITSHKRSRMEIYMKKIIIFFLSISIIFTGCGMAAGSKSQNTSNAVPTSNAKSDVAAKKITSYNGRDREKVKKHLEQYSSDYDELQKTDVFLITAPVAMRKEKLNDFIKSVKQGKKVSMDVITFTVEGDAIPVYIQYNGNDFYCYDSLVNDSNDSDDSMQFTEKKYKNMYLLNIPDKEYSNIDLSGVDIGFQEFVLSNKKIDDYASFEKLKENNFSITISPFDSEKLAKEHIKSTDK
jgi:flavodoxin